MSSALHVGQNAKNNCFAVREENYAAHTLSFVHTHSNGTSKQISNRVSGLWFFSRFYICFIFVCVDNTSENVLTCMQMYSVAQ